VNFILVDSSVWMDHYRKRNDALVDLLAHDRVLTHPFVIGEIACGTPPARSLVLTSLKLMRSVDQATMDEVLNFINRNQLHGTGCGIVDISLLASTLITPDAALWTLDKRLHALATRFDVAFNPVLH